MKNNIDIKSLCKISALDIEDKDLDNINSVLDDVILTLQSVHEIKVKESTKSNISNKNINNSIKEEGYRENGLLDNEIAIKNYQYLNIDNDAYKEKNSIEFLAPKSLKGK